MKPLRLIALTGYAGTGKDTVREMLQQEHRFEGLAFADPIRLMIASLLSGNGFDTLWMQGREHKERPIPGLGISYRELAQRLGDWGRAISPDFWIRPAANLVTELHHRGGNLIVISDLRFVNESAWVKSQGGEIWRIERPGTEPVRDHESERQVAQIQPDRVIDNSSTVEHLWTRVTDALWDRQVAA